MSDRFDTDPDDVIEPEDPDSEYEDAFDTEQRVPEPSIPEVPEPGINDDDSPITDYDAVDPALKTQFWKLVFVIKFALLSLTLGALLLYFEGRRELGGQLLGFGLILSIYVAYRYRTVKAKMDAGAFETNEGDTEDDGEGAEVDDGEGAEKDDAESAMNGEGDAKSTVNADEGAVNGEEVDDTGTRDKSESDRDESGGVP